LSGRKIEIDLYLRQLIILSRSGIRKSASINLFSRDTVIGSFGLFGRKIELDLYLCSVIILSESGIRPTVSIY